MEDAGQVKKPDGRKTRKTSPRPSKGVRKISAASNKLKALWADPEWRARQQEKNRAAVAARKGQGRFGVPDGMRKAEADKLWAEAKESAKQTMAELEKAGLFENDEAGAKEALEAAIGVMRSPQNQKIKLDAASLVLKYTKAAPASKSEITVNKAEEWLAAVAKDNDEAKPAGDA